MRKPSDLKVLITNLLSQYSKLYLNAENDSDRITYAMVLDIIFKVQEICENRKRY